MKTTPLAVLIIHGTHDTVIPMAHGRALAAQVPGSEFEPIDAPHDYFPPWPRIKRFLADHGVMRAP